MTKNIVTTSRGVKIDFDALKKANPTTKRLLAGKKKTASKVVAKVIPSAERVQHIKATVPSPIPTESTLSVEIGSKNEEVAPRKSKAKEI